MSTSKKKTVRRKAAKAEDHDLFLIMLVGGEFSIDKVSSMRELTKVAAEKLHGQYSPDAVVCAFKGEMLNVRVSGDIIHKNVQFEIPSTGEKGNTLSGGSYREVPDGVLFPPVSDQREDTTTEQGSEFGDDVFGF